MFTTLCVSEIEKRKRERQSARLHAFVIHVVHGNDYDIHKNEIKFEIAFEMNVCVCCNKMFEQSGSTQMNLLFTIDIFCIFFH